MGQRKVAGFTLMEILIVISIVSAMSVFLVRNYAKEIRTQLVDGAAAQLLDVKRAVLTHYVNTGAWPDQVNFCRGTAQVIRPAIGPLQSNPWGFELGFACEISTLERTQTNTAGVEEQVAVQTLPSLRVRQQMPNGSVGRSLAARLPSAEVVRGVIDGTDTFFVDLYIPMAMLPRSEATVANRVNSVGGELYFRPITCGPREVPKVVLVPKQVCDLVNGLGGFRVTTSFDATTDRSAVMLEIPSETDPDGWEDGFAACPGVEPGEMVSIFQYCEGAS